MKKIIFCIVLFFISNAVLASEVDYQNIYRNLEMTDFSYIHDMDPGQYYDCKDFSWSPYPLFRLNVSLFFKSITIQPGYYHLTPREYKGKDYVLFKESGLVKYIVPAYKKDFVPEYFYEMNLPKQKLTITQKIHLNTLSGIGKVFPSAKRKPMPQSYLEVSDLDNNFISVVVYYKEFRYYLILRTVKL